MGRVLSMEVSFEETPGAFGRFLEGLVLGSFVHVELWALTTLPIVTHLRADVTNRQVGERRKGIPRNDSSP